jgi:hypothetical protein
MFDSCVFAITSLTERYYLRRTILTAAFYFLCNISIKPIKNTYNSTLLQMHKMTGFLA